MIPKTNYCYNCGRHIGHQSQACWFCGTAARRTVRPERRCNFCDEVISPKAVKCPHCGEFVDGRAEAQPHSIPMPGQPQRLQMNPKGLPRPPQGAPPPVRPALAAPAAAQAIEGRRAIGIEDAAAQQRRAQRPAASADPDTIDVSFATDSRVGGLGASAPPPPQRRALPSPEGSGQSKAMAVRGAAGAIAPALKKGAAVGFPILRRLAGAAFRALRRKKPAPQDLAIDVSIEDPESRFLRCPACATECLASDHFCFHCGAPFGDRPFGYGDRIDAPSRSNVLIHLLVIGFIGLYIFADSILKEAKPEAVLPAQAASAGLSILLSGWAVMRKPGIFSRLISIIIFIFSILAIYVFSPLSGK